ncbi:MAG: YceI family protein [Anaerolineae bacterium]|nr:YceI family protein [Anaerolineae bacterium]
MTLRTHAFRLIALLLLVLLAATACAAGEPTPAADTGSAQPAATATSAPAAEAPTEEPAAAEPTVAQAVEEPTEEPVEEPTEEASAGEAPAAGGQRTFAIDPANTVVSYEVDEEFGAGALDRLGIAAGLNKTVGRTSTVDGALTLNFDGATPQLVDASFTVDISTLTSDQRMRDGRIRDEWLESSRFPTASFTATEIQNAPDAYTEGNEVTFQVAGDLTVREITQPVVFEVTATLDGDTISGVATTEFLMSSFGVDPPKMTNLFTVGDDTTIRVEFVAQAQ